MRRSTFVARALSTVAGILAVQQLAELPPPAVILFTGIAVLLVGRRSKCIACFLFGFLWASVYGWIGLRDALPPQFEGIDLQVEGQILDLPRTRDGVVRFDFRLDPRAAAARVPETVRLNWYRSDVLPKAGEHWRLRVRLRRPHAYFNPGGLDYEEWLYARGIRATGYVREDPGNARLGPADATHAVAAWRQALADRLDAGLAWSPLRGIIKALTLGVEDDIMPSQWEVLRRTGTAHLVAISGSHIGLVAAWCFVLVKKIATRFGLQRWSPPGVAAWAAFLSAFFYSALADFAIPTQRALIMIALVMGGVILHRPLRSWHTLALALLVVCLYDPMAVLAPGFWLSFGAVALIVLIVGGRLHPPRFWSALWRINAVAALGLSPLLLLFFQQVSLISPLANLLAVPVLGLIAIPLCLLATLFLLIFPVGGLWLLGSAEHLLQAAWKVLELMSAVPGAQWVHSSPPVWTLALALPGTVLLFLPRGLPGRWLGAVMLLPAWTVQPQGPAYGDVRLTLLDVGQGLAAVVQTARHALVFDTGARLGPDFAMGSAVIEPFLRHEGLGSIDVLVVSHGDNDHIGGADSLISRVPVGSIYSSVPDRLPGALPCAAGQDWDMDGVSFRMLGPLEIFEKENDNSCVLSVRAHGRQILLTGDIEGAAESALVRRYGAGLRSGVLVAPHHGSKTSSTPEFLQRVQPRIVLIPAGYRNRYGFPHPDVLARYRKIGGTAMSTADAGAIRVDVGAKDAEDEPVSYRRAHGRYWNARPDADGAQGGR
ncbi:DNA internalization-related competence protein ComEC/Rec2 [Methylococcus sp. EFPC2]|nr:DNA internalization-related competence protein ComEC/Rec2 [Methylococcus sp. EFPC2]